MDNTRARTLKYRLSGRYILFISVTLIPLHCNMWIHCTLVCEHAYVYVYVYVHVHAYIHTYIHSYILYIYTYIRTYKCVCVCAASLQQSACFALNTPTATGQEQVPLLGDVVRSSDFLRVGTAFKQPVCIDACLVAQVYSRV